METVLLRHSVKSNRVRSLVKHKYGALRFDLDLGEVPPYRSDAKPLDALGCTFTLEKATLGIFVDKGSSLIDLFVFNIDRTAAVQGANVLRSWSDTTKGALIADADKDGDIERGEIYVERDVLMGLFGTLDLRDGLGANPVTDLPQTNVATSAYTTGAVGGPYDVSGINNTNYVGHAREQNYRKFGKMGMMYLTGGLVGEKTYEVDVTEMVRPVVEAFEANRAAVAAGGSNDATADSKWGVHLATTDEDTGAINSKECKRLGGGSYCVAPYLHLDLKTTCDFPASNFGAAPTPTADPTPKPTPSSSPNACGACTACLVAGPKDYLHRNFKFEPCPIRFWEQFGTLPTSNFVSRVTS